MLQLFPRLGSFPSALNASVFRKSSIALTTSAALLIGLSLLATSPATAGEPVNKLAAACASKKDPTDRAVCMVGAMNKDTARLKAEENRLKGVQQQAKAAAPCIQFLQQRVIGANKATPDELKRKAGGELTDANVCGVARLYGYDRRAEVSPSSPN
jgi:hypothetical protein